MALTDMWHKAALYTVCYIYSSKCSKGLHISAFIIYSKKNIIDIICKASLIYIIVSIAPGYCPKDVTVHDNGNYTMSWNGAPPGIISEQICDSPKNGLYNCHDQD